MVIGWKFFYWQDENFAFLLLLYFIVTLGIRMDDISRKLGRGSGQSSLSSGEKDTIMSQLNDIKSSLRTLNATLSKLLEKTEKEVQ